MAIEYFNNGLKATNYEEKIFGIRFQYLNTVFQVWSNISGIHSSPKFWVPSDKGVSFFYSFYILDVSHVKYMIHEAHFHIVPWSSKQGNTKYKLNINILQ